MDDRTLRYFVQVVRHGAFARAAEHAHATQPTLSKAIAQLELLCGGRLLERSRSGVRLTPEGEVVYRHAQLILDGMDRMRAELDALRGLQRGELRLGLAQLGSEMLFAPLLARYRQLYPDIVITLRERGSRLLEQAVASGELDVATTLPPTDPALDWLCVRDDPLLACLPVSHPHAHAKVFQLKWLTEMPLILFEEGFALNQLIRKALERRGIAPREVIHSAQADFILAMVASGSGVVLLPKLSAAGRSLSGVVTMPVADASLRWRMGVAWRRESQSPAARAWLALVRSTVEERAAQSPAA
ncbi:LysR family transcriptional regulator [Solimonas marina]|uniref:LysR family transcriptional regulator n=1 Tax=Solimonas marina TaxID=2714601 RepID=A0A969W9B1_9GAMM|nr:LysR family transcriptional regulator [Solimonas marina]NKF23111.1 LysR family transcriptional regulator [Solimonas marina]